jgi:ABC-2 type transport system ATP-binding protein
VVERLTKRYGGRTVVDGISFTVNAGEVFAILGPNGAGKSTLVEMLEGYRVPDAGSALVLGLDPQRQGSELRRRIGLMLQEGGFYPAATPREILRLFASFFEKPVDPATLLRLVGLENSYRTRYRRLSGGEKQRLSIAVALVGQPEIVFLDEPTAGMDPRARHATWDIIRGLREKRATVVLTTHLIDEAERLADRVAVVDAGRLVALGSPAELTGDAANGEIRITFDAPVPPLDELRRLASVSSAWTDGVNQIVLRGPIASDVLVEVTIWLRSEGHVPRQIRIGHATLEEAFLNLTGKALEP